jgi:hypothetical protein
LEHKEAQVCFESAAYTAAVVMVRRTLEGVCREMGSTKRTLAESLKDLQSRGLLDNRLIDWSNALRVLGNEGAHFTGRRVSREDALDAIALCEALLDYVYVLTARFQEFQERRAGRDNPQTPSDDD